MKRIDNYISEIIIIGNWAKSCETLEQLENVKRFLNFKLIHITEVYECSDAMRIMYHLGIVDGIILSIEKLKFKNYEFQNKLQSRT